MLGKVSWRQGNTDRTRTLLEESLLHAHTVGAKEYLASARLMLGLVAQEEGDRPLAIALFKESLTIFQAMRSKAGIAYALSALAGLLDPPARAAQVLGAAAALLDTARMYLDGVEHAHHKCVVVAVQAQLNEVTFATAWAEGQAMAVEQAVAYVLAPA
jgi:hypothetical protein